MPPWGDHGESQPGRKGQTRNVFRPLRIDQLSLNRTSDQLSPRVPPAIFKFDVRAQMPRSTSRLTSPTTIPSPPLQLPYTNHRFFTPFFSTSSELLFSQLLCFHNHLRCP